MRSFASLGMTRKKAGLKTGHYKVGKKQNPSGDFAGGFFEQVVDQSLVGLGLFGGHAAELAEQLRGDADGNELLGAAGGRASDPASAAQLGIGGLRNVGEVDAAIRNRPRAPCASRGAR